jgi:glycosyltransferase involved in cell wall biosynthesis
MMSDMPTRWLVAQLGARMHYAVPRILADADLLEHLFTDICAIKGWPSLLPHLPARILPAAIRRLTGRIPHGVPVDRVTAFTQFGWVYAKRRARAKSSTEAAAVNLWANKRFCELIRNEGFGGASGLYTFNGTGLELMQAARSCGLRRVMEQTIAPKRLERTLLDEEHKRFPGWELESDDTLSDEFISREEAEWDAADVILCGSEFVREGIVQMGGPPEHCRVVPYGVDAPFPQRTFTARSGPLRVLTVGKVGLRKGSPYVLEAAKALKKEAVFRMVGSIGVSRWAEAELRKNIELTGAVPRSEIYRYYAWADVFLLPSICEGSATVTYEALSAGLPVICTPNAGSLVSDGVDGFVVPIHDASAVIQALSHFIVQPARLRIFGAHAIARAWEFSIVGYSERLLRALRNL